jgi:hypothetical protein
MGQFTVMPWGKYRGRYLGDIPLSYLAFVVDADYTAPWLRSACWDEIRRRSPFAGYEPRARCNDSSSSRWPSHFDFKGWYRRMAVACHPDHGGSMVAMKLLNELRDEVCT